MNGAFTPPPPDDPEVRLALLYMPAAVRPSATALFALDVRLATVVERAREPMLAAIKLAWWRERIEALCGGTPPPDEPLLRALPRAVVARAADLVAGWETVLEGDGPAGHAARGHALFAAVAALLGNQASVFADAGAAWALVDAARRGAATLESAADVPVPSRWPKPLRPLGMLALLAHRDARRGRLAPQGTPGRAARMGWHRLTGRVGDARRAG